MPFANPDRHAGRRWQIVYGARAAAGPECTALVELQRRVQTALPYVVETLPDNGTVDPQAHQLWIGTARSHARLKSHLAAKRLAPPPGPNGFSIAIEPAPDSTTPRRAYIAGADPCGALYGAVEFNARVAGNALPDWPRLTRDAFDRLPAMTLAEAPAVPDRGLWSWGYAIYDYRRYLDAMVRLRLNLLYLWNDVPPVNFPAVIAAARERGIRVVPSGPWGWGLTGINLASAAHRRKITATALADFDRHYRDLPVDTLYFQTLTEHTDLTIGKQTIAALATRLVNDTARQLFKRKPDLKLHFGLHASSIGPHYADLAKLDPRVEIIWEDAGLVPFAYNPRMQPADTSLPSITTFDQTLAYSRQLAQLRPGAAFGLVPKGFSWIDWPGEFEHHKGFVLGERDGDWIARRRLERQSRWDKVDSLWPQVHADAARFYAAMLTVNPRLIAAGLVEDGVIEEGIPFSVALFAETLWNPRREPAELLRRALNPLYRCRL